MKDEVDWSTELTKKDDKKYCEVYKCHVKLPEEKYIIREIFKSDLWLV